MIMIDGKEYIEVEKVKANFVDKEILIGQINKLIEGLGLIIPEEPKAVKKGFFKSK